jgi:hypothetical protein
MRPLGDGGHIARYGDLMTPCWCGREAKPIPADMVARGETWSCDFDRQMRYVRRLQRRAEVRRLVKT